MNTNKKRTTVIALLCLLIVMACMSSGCKKKENVDADTVNYTVQVLSEGGMAFEGVSVFVYTDSSLKDLVWVGKTDAEGKMSFQAASSDEYTAVLQDVPEGYVVEENYVLTGGTTTITLATALVEVTDWTDLRYELGDVIHDFSIIDCEGTEYKISELLKEKQAIVLNFWYKDCQPCKEEFPYLQEAYADFTDSIIVLGMNPVDSDNNEIAAFKKEMELTFPLAAVDPAWQDVMQITAYPTTIIIDRYGAISLIHEGSITNKESFVELFEHFSTEDYKQEVIEDMKDIVEYEPEKGSKENAEELGGLLDFDATVKAGKVRYYDLYKVNGMYLQINDENAYVIYNEETYKAKDGVVKVFLELEDTFSAAKVGIGNSGKKKAKFHVMLYYPKGALANPYTMELGKFSVHVDAGNDQGVYYEYKAKKTGKLTLKCTSATKGVDYDFTLYNLDSYEFRNFSTEGVTTKKGVRKVTVKVKKGQTVRFSVNPLPDENNEYPAGDFVFKAEFKKTAVEQVKEDTTIEYAVTVTDQNGKALQNVSVKIGDIMVKTNDKGVATAKLEKGTYKASVSLPVGYKGEKTSFTLTEKNPTVSVKLIKIVIEMQDYKVNVVDETGNPISGVIVSMGKKYGISDATGVVTLNMEKADYTVLISPPDGYKTVEDSYTMSADTKELTVVLTVVEEEEEITGTIEYSVRVVDYEQKPIANVVVSFYSGNSMVTMKQVDQFGNVSAFLEAGDYTLHLAFESDNYYVDDSDLQLTPRENSTQVLVANVLTEYEDNYFDSDTYFIYVGGNYAQMQADVYNYYIFMPEISGQYRVSVSDSSAQLGYFGGNTSFIVDQTPQNDNDPLGITINIKDGNIGASYIFGVSGVEEAVIQVVRVGDPILDDTDVPYTAYQPITTPTPFSLTIPSGKKLEYVNVLTGSTGSYNAVYNAADGYYHLNSTSGPTLYLTLSGKAPYLSLQTMISTAAIRKYFYDGDVLVKKEDYYDCISAYVACMDSKTGVYPLTEDLKYILQEYGAYIGWWNPNSYAYLFESSTVNTDIAWMYACCYLK